LEEEQRVAEEERRKAELEEKRRKLDEEAAKQVGHSTAWHKGIMLLVPAKPALGSLSRCRS